MLEKSRLAMALQSRLESVEAKAGFQVHLGAEGVFHLSPAREALNNLIKQAQDRHLLVRICSLLGNANYD